MRVVDLKAEQVSWFPISGSADVIYVGQLVEWGEDGGVAPAGAASGAWDTAATTGESVLAGIVVGVNDNSKTLSSTYNVNQITGLTDNSDTQATQLARNYFGQEGMWSKGDPQPLVQVAMIDSTTRIEAPIYSSTHGAALNLQTITTGSTTGLGYSANASDMTPVANNATSYCRTGANAGLYRVSDDTDQTTVTFDHSWPHDIAVGDTFARVNIAPGHCRMQTDSESIFIDNDAALTSDYWGIIVESLDLRTAGSEKAVFRFIPKHFGTPIAASPT